MTSRNGIDLGEQEQRSLVRAIESAMEVDCRDRFLSWIRGPFRELIPYQSVVFLELGGQGSAVHVDCLHHDSGDVAAIAFLCDPERGLAVLLARSLGGRSYAALDTIALEALLSADLDVGRQFFSAAVHRIHFLSGAACFLVLLNLPSERIEKGRHLFRLLSSHLKMALARTTSALGRLDPARMTLREREVLDCLGGGQSNREISTTLGISPITLKMHVSKIYRKLGVQKRDDAVAKWREILLQE